MWPDESTHNEPRAGVDALTYGLATLVMGDDCFLSNAGAPFGFVVEMEGILEPNCAGIESMGEGSGV